VSRTSSSYYYEGSKKGKISMSVNMKGVTTVATVGSKKCVANRSVLTAATSRRVTAPRGRMAANKMVRCDWLSNHFDDSFIGSPANVAVCFSTAVMLFAVRNGYAPGTARNSRIDNGLNLSDSGSDMITGDPAGMTFVDVLAAGSMGHIIAVGMLLGFNNMAQ